MRVLVLFDREALTGVSRTATTVAQELEKRGHTVHQLRSGPRASPRIHDLAGCSEGGVRQALSVFLTVRRLVRAEQIQVVHAHHRRLALIAWLAVRGSATTVVEHVHSVFTDKRRTSFRSDVVVALTDGLAADLRRRYPHAADRVVVCANGVDLPDVVVEPDPTPPLTLVAVGRLEPAKDPAAFGHLVQALNAEGLDVRGVWLGEGPLRAEMRALFQGYCAFPGETPSPEAWLVRATAVVSTSVREGMPLALLEGMAHGCPVLARRTGGIEETVGPRGGILWTGSAPPVDQIQAFLSDPTELRRSGEYVRERVETQFTLSQLGDRIERILEASLA